MIVTLDDAKAHLNVTGTADDALVTAQIAAAQGQVESLLGFKIEDTFSDVDQDPVPPALKQAVLLLVGHLYENREASLIGVNAQALPFGLWDLVNEHRNYWGGAVA
jgi:uncharacterized phage protein (predicted DNA packaging)